MAQILSEDFLRLTTVQKYSAGVEILMESAGAKLLVHYRKMAFMGFVAVIKNLGAISKNLSLCKQQITEYEPDVIIFIDYPGFNLRIAEFAKKAGYQNLLLYLAKTLGME